MKLLEKREILASKAYHPEALLNFMRRQLSAKNDRQLAEKLGFSAPEVCRMRCKATIICSSMLIAMHEKTGMGTLELKRIAGMES